MTKSTQYLNGILGLLNRAKAYNLAIGDYVEHFILQDSYFRVKLSNGWIDIPSEWAKDQEIMPISISEQDIDQMPSNAEIAK